MKGFDIGSDFHAALVVAALDRGCFPQAFSDWIFDQFAYADLIVEVKEAAERANYHLKEYQPIKLVRWKEGGLVWRPDPEWDCSGYRAYRYIKFVPINEVKVKDKILKNIVLIEWETGHEDRSSLIDSVLHNCRYDLCYSDPLAAFIREHREEIISEIFKTLDKGGAEWSRESKSLNAIDVEGK